METITVIICSTCKGKGEIRRKESRDYHKGIYDYWYESCSDCQGSGKLIETVTTTTKPFSKPEFTGRHY